MPRYYRRRSYRYRPRRYVRRYIRRRFKKFVNGSSKSRIRVKVPFSGAVTFTQQANAAYSDILTLSPVQYCTDGAVADNTATAYPFSAISNALFTNYAALYDEVKCDGVKLQVAITDAIPNTNWNCVTIHTCWDRKTIRSDYADAPNAADIVNSATYIPATALNNSVAKIVRSCYPSDLLEKITFVDSNTPPAGAITQVYGVANKHMRSITALGVTSTTQMSVGFTPTLSMCVSTGEAPAALRTLHVRIEGMAYYTFRNPKFGGSSSNKMAPLDDAIRVEDEAAAAAAARRGAQIARRIARDEAAAERGDPRGSVINNAPFEMLNPRLQQRLRSAGLMNRQRGMLEARQMEHRRGEDIDVEDDVPILDHPVVEEAAARILDGDVAPLLDGI